MGLRGKSRKSLKTMVGCSYMLQILPPSHERCLRFVKIRRNGGSILDINIINYKIYRYVSDVSDVRPHAENMFRVQFPSKLEFIRRVRIGAVALQDEFQEEVAIIFEEVQSAV
jgi:hypothetical protein